MDVVTIYRETHARIVMGQETREMIPGKSEIPETGIHLNIPWARYHSWSALSASTLVHARQSIAHMLARMQTEPTRTTEMAFGAAFHTLVLEPDNFAKTHKIINVTDKRQKAWREAVQKSGIGETLLTTAEYEQLKTLYNHVTGHPIVKEALQNYDREASLVWKMQHVLMKGRLDLWDQNTGLIIDLKTTRDASPSGFQRSVIKYGYDLQAAMYGLGTLHLTGKLPTFLFACVEKDFPHGVAVYDLDPRFMEQAVSEIEKILDQYRAVMETGLVPGYSPEITTIQMPAWYGREEDSESL